MPKVRGRGEDTVAKFDGLAKKENRDNLKKMKCLVLVSIKEKPECTGDFFGATAKTAVEEYGHTTFLIADEAYWHNLTIYYPNESEEVLKQKAIQLGNEWFINNEKNFLSLLDKSKLQEMNYESLPIDKKITLINTLADGKFKIVRWHEWVSQLDCSTKTKALSLYDKVEELKKGIEMTAAEFAQRHSKQDKLIFEKYFNASKNYLLEECFPIMFLGAIMGFNFIAYPGKMSQALESTFHFFVKKNYPNMMNWLHINFKKPKQKNDSDAILYELQDLLNNVSNPKAQNFSQNKNTFFSQYNDFEKKISKLPEQKRETILRLISSFRTFLDTLVEEDSIEATENTNDNSTFERTTSLF